MTITILNRRVVTGNIFQPWDVWQFFVSAADAAAVIFSHTSLEITTSVGVKKPSLTSAPWSEIYTESTVDPYLLLWTLQDNGGGIWSINFIVAFNPSLYPVFTNINDWTAFAVDSVLPSASVDITATPQDLTPAFNPVTFRFTSPQYTQPGFKYRFDVFKDVKDQSGAIIGRADVAKFKVAPTVDGTGYIDISKVLSNLVGAKFTPFTPLVGDVPECYVGYHVEAGVEYQNPWGYTNYGPRGGTGSLAGNLAIVQTPNTTPHTFTVGDQINIDTTPALVRGLHKVAEVPNNYTLVLEDVLYTGATQTVPGTVSYADGRNVGYPGLESWSGTAFNGAVAWSKFPAYDGETYVVGGSASTPPLPSARLLTSLQPFSEINDQPDKRIYVKDYQTFEINFMTEDPNDKYFLFYSHGSISSINQITEVGVTGSMKRFSIGFNVKGVGPLNSDTHLAFYVTGPSAQRLTEIYHIYPDMRCAINEYEILFMDRMGSILSFSATLRDKITGNISKKTYRSAIEYNQSNTSYNSVYDIYTPQVITYSSTIDKEIELNTDWMNDGMSLLFEELLTSPNVWIRIKDEEISGVGDTYNYYSCTVQETSFEEERQKNKRLIRKTFKVKLSSQNIINV